MLAAPLSKLIIFVVSATLEFVTYSDFQTSLHIAGDI